jgi:hypothetical protein
MIGLDSMGVCTENLIRIDCVTESPNVNGDDRATLLLPDPVPSEKNHRMIADDVWPAPGSEDTELGVLMEPEVGVASEN